MFDCFGWRLDRPGVQKLKPPLGWHRRGFWNLSFQVSTYFLLPALVGALGTTTRTTLIRRTTGTARAEMTSAIVAVASKAKSIPKAYTSKEAMVVKSKNQQALIRNEHKRKHNPFFNMDKKEGGINARATFANGEQDAPLSTSLDRHAL